MPFDCWTTETHHDMRLGFRTENILFRDQSPFQTVEIVETTRYGRLLLLDGAVMTTDHDEFVYHEMISHVPLLSHPNPKRVLVIGGGDGGTVREVARHPNVEEIVLCEIDGMVVDSCKEFFPKLTVALDDPRVTVRIADGIAYTKDEAKDFDLIIVDSTDPVGPGEGLFTEAFYRDAFNALAPGGILVAQTESPFVCQDLIKQVYPLYRRIFPIVQMYTGHVPTYPSGFWTWAFCSKEHKPEIPAANLDRAKAITQGCHYYNPAIHAAAFALPNFVAQSIAAELQESAAI